MLIGGLDPGDAAGYVVLDCLGADARVIYSGTSRPDIICDVVVCEGQYATPDRYVSRGGKKIRVSTASTVSTPFGAGYLLASWPARKHVVLTPQQWRGIALTSSGLSKKESVGQCRRIFSGRILQSLPDDVFEAAGLALAGSRLLEAPDNCGKLKRTKKGWWHLPQPMRAKKAFQIGC